MIVFHGSSLLVSAPDLKHSRSKLDFGRGFYVTPIKMQAVGFSQRFKLYGKPGAVSCYRLDEAAFHDLKYLEFSDYNESWLDFISRCRRGEDDSDFDIVSGGIADDRVFNALTLYWDGVDEKTVCLKKLRYEKPNWQICLRTKMALEYLKFVGGEEV